MNRKQKQKARAVYQRGEKAVHETQQVVIEMDHIQSRRKEEWK